jgi:WXG100 family type VII secretion target
MAAADGGEFAMSMIKVTSEELASTSAQLNAGSQEIESQLTALHNLVQSLVEADWQGAASTSFQALWQEWGNSAANLQESLTGIANLLSSAGTAYASTESQIAQSMQ